MAILTLDAALARCSASVVADGVVLAARQRDGARGQAGLLPGMVADVLAQSGLAPARLAAVAVTVGPGSFTGLRAAISLAQGLALSLGRPAIGVTVAEALRAAVPPPPGRVVWVAIDSRRGRVFLDIDGVARPCGLDALPRAAGPVAVAGDAAPDVAAWLARLGDDVLLTDARLPAPACVARIAELRLAGELPALAAQPLYVDPPEAKLPAEGLRPPPVMQRA